MAWAMTNLPWSRKRCSAAEISSAWAIDSAPSPSRITTPLIRESRAACIEGERPNSSRSAAGWPRERPDGRRIGHGLAQIQRQHHVGRQAVAPRQADHQQHQQRSGSEEETNLAMPFNTAAMIERSQRRKAGHGKSSREASLISRLWRARQPAKIRKARLSRCRVLRCMLKH